MGAERAHTPLDDPITRAVQGCYVRITEQRNYTATAHSFRQCNRWCSCGYKHQCSRWCSFRR